MPNCKKCGEHFARKFKDENGKEHNCQRRLYCFNCSPYNSHNTAHLENIIKDDFGNRLCKKCGKPFVSKRRHICHVCNVNKQRKNKKDYLISLVGMNCWRCNYGGTEKFIPLLDMHHVDPNDKMFSLNITEICKKSNMEIVTEAKKCVLLCNRCHMEYHYTDLIADEEINILHKKWKDIKI